MAAPSRMIRALRRLRAWTLAGLFALAVGAGGTAAVLALHARAAQEAAESAAPRPPLAVATGRIARTDRYTVRERYAGRIEPARQTRIAFERGGLVAAMQVEEGDRVAAGAALALLDVAELRLERDRLEAERESLMADRALAERTVDRRRRLSERGFETDQSFDEARFRLGAIAGRIAATDARLARVALDLEKSRVVAPFAGTIAARLIDEGAVVSAGTAVADLQETGRPEARIGVPPERAAELSPGDPLAVRVGGARVAGRLVAISPDLDPATRTVALRIALAPETRLTMGEIAHLTLERTVEAEGAWVPLAALSEGTRGLWTLRTVVGNGQGGWRAGRESVAVLHVAGGRAYVSGSFADGARIVADGPHRLSDGQPVAPREG